MSSKVVFISSPAPNRNGSLNVLLMRIALYLFLMAICIGFWVIVGAVILHFRGKL